MAPRGLAYLDGGPADGTTLELDQPHWAPIGALRVEVDGVEVIYVRIRQREPVPGQPWRYVPQDALRADDSMLGVDYDPDDD